MSNLIRPDGAPLNPMELWKDAVVGTTHNLGIIQSIITQPPTNEQENSRCKILVQLISLLYLGIMDNSLLIATYQQLSPLLEQVKRLHKQQRKSTQDN